MISDLLNITNVNQTSQQQPASGMMLEDNRSTQNLSSDTFISLSFLNICIFIS